jgi:hypothetical protein
MLLPIREGLMRKIVVSLAAMLALSTSCATPGPPAAIEAAAQVAPAVAAPPSQEFRVTLAPGVDSMSGRLIALAVPAASVRTAPFPIPWNLNPGSDSCVAAQEAPLLTSAGAVRFDADTLADPLPFSRIKPGEYWVQVRLDVNHNAAYRYSDPDADYVSTPVKLQLPTSAPVDVTLQPEREVVRSIVAPKPLTGDDAEKNRQARVANEARDAEADAHIKPIDFVSPALSEFWGKPMHVRGIVLLPPDYEASKEKYPTVYRTEGFGGSLAILPLSARQHYRLMKSGDTPPMIRVFLDHSSPWGTHEFADSVNNGPWGFALTEELIPALEKQYRMDAKPSGRFTTGHSSGGWFAIWQQVRYPEVFGGTWARSPDPVDFRSFTGIDIYRDGANAYVRPDGSAQYLVRDASGKELVSFKEYSQQENVLGDYGGQIDSFDWVFSPKGVDGRPQPLFDRATGKVDPEVARYWREHFDISYLIRRDWKSLKPVLDGKIHLVIGTMDTFHLNEAAVLLDREMQKLGAKADFLFMEGRTHGNIDRIGDDPQGLEKKIAWEMWAVAHPNSPLKPKPYVAPPRPLPQ